MEQGKGAGEKKGRDAPCAKGEMVWKVKWKAS